MKWGTNTGMTRCRVQLTAVMMTAVRYKCQLASLNNRGNNRKTAVNSVCIVHPIMPTDSAEMICSVSCRILDHTEL